MPIDFNPHIMFNNLQPKVVNQQSSVLNKPIKDVFVKSVDINYDGIKIDKKSFGKIEKSGEEAELYTITNKNGASVELSTFGATITSIRVPDKFGKLIDVTHGYDNVTPYEKSPIGHAGGTIGPVANKISDGRFKLNNEEYTLECNKDNGKSHSHGGTNGFDVQNWKGNVLKDGVEFTYMKKDMENGYPGNVTATVTYKLDNSNRLHIQYNAVSDKDTLINITNHTYFNLDGAETTQENSVLDHIVTLPNSSFYTKNNEISIPTGEISKVDNTPFDFRTSKRIGDVINSDHEQIRIGSGFDHNYCIDNYDGNNLVEAADVKSSKTGIGVKVLTNLPGFQFYTANHLGKSAQPVGKSGSRYEKRSAFCVEPQFYPNAINTDAFLEKGILKSGENYNREIVYSFYTEK